MSREQLLTLLNRFDQILWGDFLVYLLIAIGIFYTIRLKGLQFRYLGTALKMAVTRKDDHHLGDISQFQSLMTSLAAAIGISNIAGVATAIVAGGMGAIFWMWVIALVGMSTKYAEAILAVKYRKMDAQGNMQGGPMVYIEEGLGWKKLAIAFSFFGTLCAFAGGNLTQSNSIAIAVVDFIPISKAACGIILAILTFFILLKGIKSIGLVSSYLVPLMALLYIGFGIVVIGSYLEYVPEVFKMIVSSAFHGQAAFGGFLGASIAQAIQFGVARGISSSEAGLGSAPIAAAAAKTDYPGRQALISMSGTFISSMIVCTITALTIGVSKFLGTVDSHGVPLNGVELVMKAFSSVIPFGDVIVALGVLLFGYSTIIGWAYYGEQCFNYIFKTRFVFLYRLTFCIIVFLGAVASLEIVWPIVDIMNGLMALPNIIALFFLSKEVVDESNLFLTVLEKEKIGLTEKAI
ncbi:MAG: sodium:alanine symporter family protein [Chlamydiae bacterium]|jgi:AGCS family alanine or glycine:cation symporter|nr:sodium:alanine symporter family protein [Chlamydiota bacterium]